MLRSSSGADSALGNMTPHVNGIVWYNKVSSADIKTKLNVSSHEPFEGGRT